MQFFNLANANVSVLSNLSVIVIILNSQLEQRKNTITELFGGGGV